MAVVLELTFADARRTVTERVLASRSALPIERVKLPEAAGRVLAGPVRADRDLPPAARSLRDGYAVRSADTPGRLRIKGELRAGQTPEIRIGADEAAEIMTGALVPNGADAVVMVEHCQREDGVVLAPYAPAGEHLNARGSHAHRGDILLEAGRRLGYAELALAASVGAAQIDVFMRPTVAILTTGDEVVDLDARPAAHQVRDANAMPLAAQVQAAGGVAHVLPRVGDTLEETLARLEDGLRCGLLLVTGGVSAGKYDFVEAAFEHLGAELFFTRVRMQPGRPCVFGRVRDRYFFGLPGNPASAMVCFETLARAALELLAGIDEPRLGLTRAVLTKPFRQAPGLRRFLPAMLGEDGTLTPVDWAGSGDVAAVARANVWMVTDPERERYSAGDWMEVLKR